MVRKNPHSWGFEKAKAKAMTDGSWPSGMTIPVTHPKKEFAAYPFGKPERKANTELGLTGTNPAEWQFSTTERGENLAWEFSKGHLLLIVTLISSFFTFLLLYVTTAAVWLLWGTSC